VALQERCRASQVWNGEQLRARVAQLSPNCSAKPTPIQYQSKLRLYVKRRKWSKVAIRSLTCALLSENQSELVALFGCTHRVTTGHNGEVGRGAILPVSARDINASVRANI
jgi:hypothetical protein